MNKSSDFNEKQGNIVDRHYDMQKLVDFVRKDMPVKDLEYLQSQTMSGPFIFYLVVTYNRIVTNNGGMRLLTNAKDLFISREEQDAFVAELRKYIVEVLQSSKIEEEKTNVQNGNHQTR